MPTIELIEGYASELIGIRRDFHRHPEIGFQETRTAARIAETLETWGLRVHRGLGGTGLVAEIEGRDPDGPRIGLRADMDALPIHEETGLEWSSTVPGCSHACGHDGHMAMLLGAARYLAHSRDFNGTAVIVFQPAEEGLGGARAMLKDGLFERFPCDEIHALHNAPGFEPGKVYTLSGPACAGADFFDIRITGRGSHAAYPHQGNDPVVVAVTLAQALQSIVSRNINPNRAAVLSVTRIAAGSAYNVIPNEAVLSGTVRAFSDEVRQQVRDRMVEIADGVARAFGARIDVESRDVFSVLENDAEATAACIASARTVVGAENVVEMPEPVMGSEDFADFLRHVPGCYFWLGHAGRVPVHNPGFVFDDAIVPLGASVLARIVEDRSRSLARAPRAAAPA